MMMLSNLSLDASASPTLFELSMAEAFQSSMRAGLDYAIDTLGHGGNEWALKAGPRRKEIFLVTMTLLQRHYLAKYGGSFEEHFYGLKRSKDGKALTSVAKLTSLIELALVPYARENLSVFPWFRPIAAFSAVWALGFRIAYLFGKTKFNSPLLWMQNVVVGRLTTNDLKILQDRSKLESISFSTHKFQYVTRALTSGLQTSIVLGMVLFMSVEYYNSPENRAAREAQQQRRFGPALVPPPPMPPNVSPVGKRLLIDTRFCPLCGEVRDNPALSTSGYCFCYKCIHAYVTTNGRCPVAGTSCTPLEIRRVFAT